MYRNNEGDWLIYYNFFITKGKANIYLNLDSGIIIIIKMRHSNSILATCIKNDRNVKKTTDNVQCALKTLAI